MRLGRVNVLRLQLFSRISEEYRFSNTKYFADDSDEEPTFEREQRAKKQSTDLIQKQFALRRSSQEVSQETIDKLLSKRSRVQAPASTSKKVKGLSVATREMYLNKISEVLWDNYSECSKERNFDRKDVEGCGVAVEYSVFSTTTTMTMYRSTLARLVSFFDGADFSYPTVRWCKDGCLPCVCSMTLKVTNELSVIFT